MDILDNIHKIIIAVMVILAIFYGIALHGSIDYKEITTKEKWVKYQNDDAKYLVSDVNDNVYSLEDSWWFLTFDASDRYSRIELNTTYKIKTIGWRIRILSQYPNIVEFNKIPLVVMYSRQNENSSIFVSNIAYSYAVGQDDVVSSNSPMQCINSTGSGSYNCTEKELIEMGFVEVKR